MVVQPEEEKQEINNPTQEDIELIGPMPFNATLEGEAYLTISGDTVKVSLRCKNPNAQLVISNPVSAANLDLSLFADRQQARDWVNATLNTFRSRLWDFLAHEAIRFHADVANSKLDKMGIESIEMQDIIKKHARDTETDLRKRFNVHGAGNYSAWTKLDLTQAVRRAIARLPKQDRNYENVAAWLREHYPKSPPASGQALKQLLRRHKIDWMSLKREQ